MSQSDQYFIQTIVEGGAIQSTFSGCFADDSTADNQNLVIVRTQAIEIISRVQGEFQHSLRIYLNQRFDQACLLQAGGKFKKDFILAVTAQLDLIIFSFQGNTKNLSYAIEVQVNLLQELAKVITFPINKRFQHSILSTSFDSDTRLCVFNYREISFISEQLLFIIVSLKDGLQLNISTPKLSEEKGFIQKLFLIDPIDRQFKGQFMKPLLGYILDDRLLTFELEMTRSFTQFKGISYFWNDIQLIPGPFVYNGLPTQNMVRFSYSDENKKMIFPCLIASYFNLKFVYNLDQVIETPLPQGDGNKHMVPLSRPLCIQLLINRKNKLLYEFLVAYDDGNLLIVSIDKNTKQMNAKLCNSPQINSDQKLLRMPTCTSIVYLNYYTSNSEQNFAFLASQSSNALMVQVYDDYSLSWSLLKDRFRICLGSVQDLCTSDDGRMFVAASQGRDASIILSRFGFQLKGYCQIILNDNLSQNKTFVNSFISDSRVIMILSDIVEGNKYFNILFDKQTNNYIFNTIDCPQHSLQVKSPLISCYSYLGEIIFITTNAVYYSGQIYEFNIIQVDFISDLMIFLTQDGIFLYQLGDKQNRTIFELSKIEGHFQTIAKLLVRQKLFIFASSIEGLVTVFMHDDVGFEKIFQYDFEIKIYDIKILQANKCNYMVFGSLGNAHAIEFKLLNQNTVEIDASMLCRVLVKKPLCKMQPYYLLCDEENQVFIKSGNSLYQLQTHEKDLYCVPLLTCPLNMIKFASFLSAKVSTFLNEQKAVQDSVSDVNQALFITPFSVTSQNKYQNYYSKQLMIIQSDGLLNTNLELQQYSVGYIHMDEDYKQSNYLQLVVPFIMFNYSIKRFLIRRTPTKVERRVETHNFAVITEQYLGKCQVRFFDQTTNIEYYKVIPQNCNCTQIHFATIDGRNFCIVAVNHIIDIYETLKQQSIHSYDKNMSMQTKLLFYEEQKGEYHLFGDLAFLEEHPCSQFMYLDKMFYCAVGSKIKAFNIDISIINMKPVIGMVNLKILESPCKQLITDFILTNNQFYAIESGSLFVFDKDLNIITLNSSNQLSDIKLITPFLNGIMAVSYDNQVAVISKDLQVQARIDCYSNINCIRTDRDKVSLGTDCGAIIAVALNTEVFMMKLQQEIVEQFSEQQRKIKPSSLLNFIDGDIINQFLSFTRADQQAIAVRLNVSEEFIFDIIKFSGIKLGI